MNWIAASLIVIGYLTVIWKNRGGFIIQLGGCGIYIATMLHVDLSVVFVNLIFAAVNLIGYIRWSTSDKE
jgi:hypothetical protein